MISIRDGSAARSEESLQHGRNIARCVISCAASLNGESVAQVHAFYDSEVVGILSEFMIRGAEVGTCRLLIEDVFTA